MNVLSHPDAERSILGAILLDNSAFFQCGGLSPQDFTSSFTTSVFTHMSQLIGEGKPADIVTLCDATKDPESISALMNGVPHRPDISHYTRMVKDAAARRRLQSILNAGLSQIEDMSETTADCISVAHDRVLELAGQAVDNKSAKLSEYSSAVFQSVKDLANSDPYQTIGISTGIAQLDALTTGLRTGELWIIGSWTGSGKTALMTQILSLTAKNGSPVLWFTAEMTKRQVMLRIIPQISQARIKANDLRNPRNMNTAQLRLLDDIQKTLDKWPMWVNDATSLDITNLVATARMMHKRHGIKLIGVDYLQLLSAQGESRYDRVTKVSEGLRELAKSIEVPVLVVSQLAKPEEKKERSPRIFDLKESGSIEQDSHVILLPYRPKDKGGKYLDDDVIIVGKQREGPTGSVSVVFNRDSLMFEQREVEGESHESLF